MTDLSRFNPTAVPRLAPYQRSLLALLAPFIALGLQFLLWPLIRPSVWFLFYPAVFASSWIGGLRAGLAAAATSTALVLWFVESGEDSFAESPVIYFPAAVFFVTGVLFALFHDRMKKANARIADMLAASELAKASLEHAVKERRVFAGLIENSSDFIGVADPSGKPIYINPAGRRMVGLSPDEPVESTRIPDYYPPAERRFASDVIVKSTVANGHWQGETYFRHWQTGRAIPVSDTHFMIRVPESGQLLGIGTITRDISDVRAAREELEQTNTKLRASEAKFSGLIAIAADAIISLDEGGQIVIYNEGAQQIFGWAPEEIIGKSIDILIPRRFHQLHQQHIHDFRTEPLKARRMGERRAIFGLRKNGIEFPAEAAISKLEVAGQLLFTVVLRDVTEQKRLERELAEARSLLENVLESATDYAIIAKDPERRVLTWNEGARRLYGYDPEEVVGKSTDLLHTPEDVRSGTVAKIHRRALMQGRADGLFRGRRKNGSEFLAHTTITRRVDASGKPIGYLLVGRDVTEEENQVAQLRQAAAVFTGTAEAVMIIDSERRIVAVNAAYTRTTGFTPEDVIGKQPAIQRSGRHDEAFYQNLWHNLDSRGYWQGEIWNRRKNGEIYPAWENVSAIRNDRGQIVNYVAIFSDIGSIDATEARLEHMAHHDALTGLPNRLLFAALLEQSLARAKRHGKQVALLLLDVDRFKLINDTLGHAAGDHLLKDLAARLTQCVRAEDTVARLGGDEFSIILEEMAHAQDAALVAEKILKQIGAPVDLEGKRLLSSCSIGISVYPDDTSSAEELLKAADAAMYRAKQKGRHAFEFYTPELTAEAEERLTLELELPRALANGELVLHYQPQLELATGRIIGMEALLRWMHPTRGSVPPSQIIKVAEESGFIDALGKWIIAEAIRQAVAWNAQGLPSRHIAVNLSSRQFMMDHIVPTVDEELRGARLGGWRVLLEVEITETVVSEMERCANVLKQLRSLGVSVAIDDFGTGYSSLSRLKALPIDVLKIDRSFIREIPLDTGSRAIAAAIISLGHELGLKVVAEGVETEEQLEFLRAQRCDAVQGFLICKPMGPEDVTKFLLGHGSAAAA